MHYIYHNGELYHYGVKGMKWGVRRKAKKDAKEFARAKMYYGEGAGNRRKLIKATVNERSKDPAYKEAFDKYLEKQDMADHAAKAKAERARNTAFDWHEFAKDNYDMINNYLRQVPDLF